MQCCCMKCPNNKDMLYIVTSHGHGSSPAHTIYAAVMCCYFGSLLFLHHRLDSFLVVFWPSQHQQPACRAVDVALQGNVTTPRSSEAFPLGMVPDTAAERTLMRHGSVSRHNLLQQPQQQHQLFVPVNVTPDVERRLKVTKHSPCLPVPTALPSLHHKPS